MLSQAVYPVECMRIVSCQRQFRQATLDSLRNLGEFSLEVPLEDEQILSLRVALLLLEENYSKQELVIVIIQKCNY